MLDGYFLFQIKSRSTFSSINIKAWDTLYKLIQYQFSLKKHNLLENVLKRWPKFLPLLRRILFPLRQHFPKLNNSKSSVHHFNLVRKITRARSLRIKVLKLISPKHTSIGKIDLEFLFSDPKIRVSKKFASIADTSIKIKWMQN